MAQQHASLVCPRCNGPMRAAPVEVVRAVVTRYLHRLSMGTYGNLVLGQLDEAKATQARVPFCDRCRIVVETGL